MHENAIICTEMQKMASFCCVHTCAPGPNWYTVIAEGVETKEQLAFLSKEGCNEMQGFLIGRPKPIRDYGELVGREKTRSASVALAS